MVALPETTSARHENWQERMALRETCVLRRAAGAFLGVSLVVSAAGLWLFASAPDDAALALIKLLVSVSMLLLGLMFLGGTNRSRDEPELRIDTRIRRLSIVHFGTCGKPSRIEEFDIDSFAEFSLRDGALHARDATGRQVVAIPVSDRATENAIRRSFGLHA